MVKELLLSCSVLAGIGGGNFLWCLVKQIDISDKIEIARRGSSVEVVLEFLEKARDGMEKHRMTSGYPLPVKREQEDLGTLYRLITDMIDDLKNHPENLSQIKQKLAMTEVNFGEIVKRNHYLSLRSPGFNLLFTSWIIAVAIAIMVATEFVNSMAFLR